LPFIVPSVGDEDSFEDPNREFNQMVFPDPDVSIKQVVISVRGPVFLSTAGHVYIPVEGYGEFALVDPLKKLPLENIVEISASLESRGSFELWSLDSNGNVHITTLPIWEGVYKTEHSTGLSGVTKIQFPYLINRGNQIFSFNSAANDGQGSLEILEINGEGVGESQFVDMEPPGDGRFEEPPRWLLDRGGNLWFDFDHEYVRIRLSQDKPVKKMSYPIVLTEDGMVYEKDPMKTTILSPLQGTRYAVPVKDLWSSYNGLGEIYYVQLDENGYVYSRSEDQEVFYVVNHLADLITDMVETGKDQGIGYGTIYGGSGVPLETFSQYERDLPSIVGYDIHPNDRYGHNVIHYQTEDGRDVYVRVQIDNETVFAPAEIMSELLNEHELPPLLEKVVKRGTVATYDNGAKLEYFIVHANGKDYLYQAYL
jgi:hypothetical protein